MRHWVSAILITIGSVASLPVVALETKLVGMGGAPVFSQEFRQELADAGNDASPVQKLEELYASAQTPQEQAAIELGIARLYNQRTGLVDFPKAIQWYDKALVRDLPPAVIAEHSILRGNSHEVVKHHREAIADYIRGMLACMHYNLPEKWPDRDSKGKLQQPALNSGIELEPKDLSEAEKARKAERKQKEQQQRADYSRERTMIEEEQNLMRHRYYYVEAIKRVIGQERITIEQVREMAAELTNRADRIEEIIRRVEAPNPRPWP